MAANKHLRIVIGGLGVGGAERHLSYILPQLIKKDYQIRILTLTNQDDLVPLLKEAGIKIDMPPAGIFKSFPLLLRKGLLLFYSLYRLIQDFRRDPYAITHFFLPEAYILGMIAAKMARVKKPLVMSRRSLNLYQQHWPGVAWLEKWLHSFTTFVLGNSQRVVQQLQFEEGIPPNKLGLIYNGIDLSAFQNIKPPEIIRQELGIKPDALVFIIVANLIPYKGHRDLLEALALIQHELPKEWSLLAIGDDRGSGNQLVNFATEQGIAKHIHLLGLRSDVANLLSASDIGILASHEEGFSNAIIEGMAAGLPMVVTDVGGNAEAVIDGETGIVVPARDISAMSKALLELAVNAVKRQEMGLKGKQRVAEHFTLSACVQRYEALYEALAAGKTPVRQDNKEISLP